MKIKFTLLFFLSSLVFFSQVDSALLQKISLKAGIESYYAYDVNRTTNTKRLPFLYNHARSENFSINHAYLGIQYADSSLMFSTIFHTGSYVMDNMGAEPSLFQNINEAWLAVCLNRKKQNWWLQTGIFPSHIGSESVFSNENPTATRSLTAESSPYYLSGMKLQFTPTHSWDFSALICNGWQRIKPIIGNSLPSFGSQIVYKKHKKTQVHWSTFVGSEYPDSTRRMRYFSNLGLQQKISAKTTLYFGLDLGLEQKAKHSKSYAFWTGSYFIVKQDWNKQWANALRFEYFTDPASIIAPVNNNYYFSPFSCSVNLDYTINNRFLFRFEPRLFYQDRNYFNLNGEFSKFNTSILVSFSAHL